MAEAKDYILLLAALLFVTGSAIAAGINVSQFLPDQGKDTGESQASQYQLTTSITVEGETNDILIDENSFSYDTAECSLFNCNQLSFSDSRLLAFGGVNKAELTTTIYNRSSGQKFAEINKFIGEVGILERQEFTQSFSPVPPGNYRIQYTVTADSDVFSIPVERQISKNIRVPETVTG